MAFSSNEWSLRRRTPHFNSEDDRNVDDDPPNKVEGIMTTSRVDAPLSSSLHPQVKENFPGFDTLGAAASHSVSSETAHEERLDFLSDTGQQRTSRKNRTSPLIKEQTFLSHSKNRTSPLKKQIFLSHSSAQGRFVEQLDEDLRNEGYLPFFHKDPASLPKGEKFPERIFQFARECDVAVVVLSEKYLLSKWPMLELATFVDAQKSDNKKILPLFYELEVSALKDEKMRRRMFHAWDTHAQDDARIDLIKWRDAVSILSSINGEVFDKGSEVAFRKAIVKSIYNLCPPDVEFNVTNMEGNERLCQLVAGLLEKKMKLKEGQLTTLGLYGMGGLGKTTLCKALCNHFGLRFYGRVCYLDFASGDTLALKKEALRRLTDLRSDSILDQFKYEVQVDGRLTELLPQQDVFLAIDNLPSEVDSIKWSVMARIVESLSKSSMCIVTTRSLETLKRVPSLETANIMPFPSLTEAEAVNVFGRVALPERSLSSLTPEESEVVRTCVNLCVLNQFHHDPVYHPMALEAFGYSLQEVHNRCPLEWEIQQAIPTKLADDDLTKIYEIMGTLYNTLPNADKLLFMDVAVFAPREKLVGDLDILLKWLAEVHDTDERNMRRRMRKFASLSLLELREASVEIHDFSIDFAHYELRSESDRTRERCVFKEGGDPLPVALQGTPSGKCWEKLVRVRLQVMLHRCRPVEAVTHFFEASFFYRFPGKKLKEWANLIVLHLEFGGRDIDIGPLRCLRALHLIADHNLKTFTCSKPLEQLRFVKFFCLHGQVKKVPSFTSTRLQEFDLNVDMISLPMPVTLPPASTALTVLRLERWYSGRLHHELDLGPFPNLVELAIVSEISFHGSCELYILGLSALTKLKKLILLSLPIVGPLVGLECCTNLESLVLRSHCSKITRLPELDCFPNLYHLSVSGTDIIELKGVEKLLKLRELYCLNCAHLESLPYLAALPELFVVNVGGCPLLGNVSVPDCCNYVQEVPRLSTLSALSEEVVKSMEGPWAAIQQRFANNIVAVSDTPSAETGAQDARYQMEQELDVLRRIAREGLDQGVKIMEDPRYIARCAANAKRMERDRAQHVWDNEDIFGKLILSYDKAIGIISFLFTNRITLTVIFLLCIYSLFSMGAFFRKKVIIQTVVKTMCEVITGVDWMACEIMYTTGCRLLLSGLGFQSNSTRMYCDY